MLLLSLVYIVHTAHAGTALVSSEAGSLIQRYCIDCHNPDKTKGKLDLQSALESDPDTQPEIWQRVADALEFREMPPDDEPDLPRPSEQEYRQALTWLETNLGKGDAEITFTSVAAGLPVLDAYCTACHSGPEPQSGLDITRLLEQPLHTHPDTWEQIIRKMNARQMPPHGKKWPDQVTYAKTVDYLERSMDFISTANPNPGRTSTFRRMTRAEYANAIRDLLSLEVNANELLPRDEVSHGFDNITVTELTPTLLDRYISAAREIARKAVGSPMSYPEAATVRVKTDLTQSRRMQGLPLGTRGGVSISHYFPRSGTYEIQINLTRDRNEHVEGLSQPHQLEVMLNRELLETFEVTPPVKGKTLHSDVDKHLNLRAEIEAGAHELGVTFIKGPDIVLEQLREPHQSSFNFHRHPRNSPAIYQVSITGPVDDMSAGSTASRLRIFGDRDPNWSGSREDAAAIMHRLARLAYRRPVTPDDMKPLMAFYDETSPVEGFEKGIEAAISALLVNPNFLFRIERDPADGNAGDVYAVSDLELASRLSFFLWSSIPDEELLTLAETGRLSQPDVLTHQVTRMLNDNRSASMIKQFAGQWLYLRNMESVAPDLRMYPDFDDNLRQAMRRETELLFEHVMQQDKSVLELITADYTFLNERLARHYGMSGIYGDRFRRIDLEQPSDRGGLLRHGSILSLTSYANRTSPVIRGAWILENLVGSPPPPPPPNVPALEEVVISENLPLRERLAAHRENPSCAGCHELMDPIGFALEGFDAVGQRRFLENGIPIDSSGRVADGTEFLDVDDLEAYILKYPENFVRTMVEKLMTFALGRGIEHYDMPAVRDIVRSAEPKGYTFSSLITGVVQSRPFQQRIIQ